MTKLRACTVKNSCIPYKTLNYSFGSMRILLAEDDKLNRKVTQIMLKHLGYSADVVTNGLDVIRVLKHRTYDLILMNIVMPEMDGFETTREICKLLPDTERPKIIAFTG